MSQPDKLQCLDRIALEKTRGEEGELLEKNCGRLFTHDRSGAGKRPRQMLQSTLVAANFAARRAR